MSFESAEARLRKTVLSKISNRDAYFTPGNSYPNRTTDTASIRVIHSTQPVESDMATTFEEIVEGLDTDLAGIIDGSMIEIDSVRYRCRNPMKKDIGWITCLLEKEPNASS